MVQLWLLLEAGVTCRGKVIRMSLWKAVVGLDLESPVSCCWDYSCAVKNSIPSENVFHTTGSSSLESFGVHQHCDSTSEGLQCFQCHLSSVGSKEDKQKSPDCVHSLLMCKIRPAKLNYALSPCYHEFTVQYLLPSSLKKKKNHTFFSINQNVKVGVRKKNF